MLNISETPHPAEGTDKPAATITDKKGYGARWQSSVRTVDNWIARGLPHLKIGARRVRIDIAEADAWMRSQFSVQRRA